MNEPLDSDLALRAALRRMPQSVEPERDLWAGIRQQIAEQAKKSGADSFARRTVGVRWAIAASVAGLAIGVLATRWLQQAGPPLAASMPASVDLPASTSAPSYSFVPASTDAVRQQLRANVTRQLAGLPPATRKKVEKNLALIKDAVVDIQAALAKDPGNALLQDLLVTTYQNELDTLANVQALTNSAHSEVSI